MSTRAVKRSVLQKSLDFDYFNLGVGSIYGQKTKVFTLIFGKARNCYTRTGIDKIQGFVKTIICLKQGFWL
jgi:hypothetical protein